VEDEPALAAANRVIARALASGELARWAGESGLTWVAPRPPDVNPPFNLFALRGE
jgi:hypothetical protein